MERTHEPFHVDKLSYLHWTIMDMPTSFIWFIVTELLNMAVIRSFEVMLGQRSYICKLFTFLFLNMKTIFG
jgi:hypothetical protein